jgi:secreted PhoX family phosphatase
MTKVGRRAFLQGAAATTGGVLVSGTFPGLIATAVAKPPDRFRTLGPVADLRDGIVRLHVPPGFQYRSFHDTDTAPDGIPNDPRPPVFLDDGTRLPGRHDGMAAFPGPNGNVWLIRNHELNNPAPPLTNPQNAFGDVNEAYDAHGLGGTTSILVTPFGEVVEAWTSLNGTMMNCAGGGMPWGAWVTCEETVNGPDVGPDFTGISNQFLEQPHGFIFEVPVGGQSNRVPIMSAGRFAHEAAAYSPTDNALYLTEDNFAFPSGFYRYLPPNNPMQDGHIEDGGTLQMLKVVGVDDAHLEAGQTIGATYPIEWVEIPQPFPGANGRFTSPTTNDQALNFVGNQGRAQHAAGFSRLEGAKFTRNEIYFTSTQGGGAAEAGPELLAGYGNGTGQLWSYSPRTQTLTCRYQAPSNAVLDFPDNITAKSDRGTIVLCEDGAAPNFIRGLTRDGELFDIALNRLTRNSDGAPRFGEEFAGATFGPGTDTLFVNIQATAGISFAIWGPWGRIGV